MKINNNLISFSLSSCIHKLIFLVLLLTPVFSLQESLALIFGGLIDNSTALTSVYIKGIKDFIFFLILLIFLLHLLISYNINKLSFLLIIYLFLIISFGFIFHKQLLIFLSGIRWLFPIILLPVFIKYLNINVLKRIGVILFFVFIVHFGFQILQLFFAGGWFGLNSFGLSARNPGIFFIPSTASFFSIIVLFFSMFYIENVKFKKIIFTLIPISVLLTASGTGVAVYIVCFGLYILDKKMYVFLPILSIFSFIFFFFFVDLITGRSGLIQESFGTRVDIFFDLLKNANLFSNELGFGTSTGYLIANEYGLNFKMTSTESTYASILVNLGLLNFIIILFFITFFILIFWIKRDKEMLIFSFIFALFGATTSIFEAFPMNFLFSILLGFYIQRKNFISASEINKYA